MSLFPSLRTDRFGRGARQVVAALLVLLVIETAVIVWLHEREIFDSHRTPDTPLSLIFDFPLLMKLYDVEIVLTLIITTWVISSFYIVRWCYRKSRETDSDHN